MDLQLDEKRALVSGSSAEIGAAQVARAATEAFGGIDILVNNSGGRHPQAKSAWFDVGVQDWIDSYNINLLSAVRLIHHLTFPMKRCGWGGIINISCLAAQATSGHIPDYAGAKRR